MLPSPPFLQTRNCPTWPQKEGSLTNQRIFQFVHQAEIQFVHHENLCEIQHENALRICVVYLCVICTWPNLPQVPMDLLKQEVADRVIHTTYRRRCASVISGVSYPAFLQKIKFRSLKHTSTSLVKQVASLETAMQSITKPTLINHHESLQNTSID